MWVDLLNTSPPKEMDNRGKNYPSSMGRKQTTYGFRQKGLLGIHGIGGDNIGLMKPFI